MVFVILNQNFARPSRGLIAGSGSLILGDKQSMLSKCLDKNRKFLMMIVAIAVLVLMLIFCVPITFTHLMSCNHSNLKSSNSPDRFSNSIEQFYVFGGEYGYIRQPNTYDNNNYILVLSKYQSSVSRLNTSFGEWTDLAKVPNDAIGMCGAVIGDKICLFGGYNYIVNTSKFKNVELLNAAYVYDTSTDRYTSLQPMPEPRKSCGAAVLNGYVYVAGGSTEKGEKNINMSSVIRYNIKTDQWSTVSPMNTPRSITRLVQLRGRLYAIGGAKTVEVYDPSADRWSFVAKPLTDRQFVYPSLAVHDGKIYVLDELIFEVYFPDTNQWHALKAPEGYKFRSLLSANDKLWTVGAGYRNDTSWISLDAIYTYEIPTQQWTRQYVEDRFYIMMSQFSNIRSLQAFVVNQ